MTQRRSPRQPLTRADLPEVLTPEAVRELPLPVLRRLARPGNGILDAEEQTTFDAIVHEVMSGAAGRISQQLSRTDWANVRRDLATRNARRGAGAASRTLDDHLRRLARGIDEQVDAAESLAPGVDWSFAQPGETKQAEPETTDDPDPDPDADADADSDSDSDSDDTVSDLEDRLSQQVELVNVMSEIAEVSKRTYQLEQQRDLQNTRSVFFGFVVSVAVLVAGWAPIVAAEDWAERLWILALTIITCVIGALVYGLIRTRQNKRLAEQEEHDEQEV